MKHKSAVPGFASVALGSNSAPAWWRFNFCGPKERACLCRNGEVSENDSEMVGDFLVYQKEAASMIHIQKEECFTYLSTPGASFEERNTSCFMPSRL